MRQDNRPSLFTLASNLLRRRLTRAERHALWQAWITMLDAMDAAGFPYQKDNYEIWRAFIGFGESYVEYVNPCRYRWPSSRLHLYDQLKAATAAFTGLRDELAAKGRAVPRWHFIIVRGFDGLHIRPTCGAQRPA